MWVCAFRTEKVANIRQNYHRAGVNRLASRALCAAALFPLSALAVVLPVAQDTSSNRGTISAVAGKATSLSVSATKLALISFNLAETPVIAPGDIRYARLRFYLPRVVKTGGGLHVRAVTGPWSESAPGIVPFSNPITTIPPEELVAKRFVSVDVTDAVKAWAASPPSNSGFALTAGDALTNLAIGSKEGSGTGYPAELEIELTNPTAPASIDSSALASNLRLKGTVLAAPTAAMLQGSLPASATLGIVATSTSLDLSSVLPNTEAGIVGLSLGSPQANTYGVYGEGGQVGVYGTGLEGVRGLGFWGVRGETLEEGGIGVIGLGGEGGTGVVGDARIGGMFSGQIGTISRASTGEFAGSPPLTTSLGALAVCGFQTVNLSLLPTDRNIGLYAAAASFAGRVATAGYFSGDVTVTGTLSKGGGSFKIDHPVDPENKYLSHSFVESPDMKNIYDGVVTLDEAGHAVVELPSWFQTLNRDFRYQLTAIGKPAPGLHVAHEMESGRFGIAGGQAGQRVSWQVTGIRRDAWANAHRIPTEEEKDEKERGFYLHPEAFGFGPERSVDAVQRATASPAGAAR